MSRLGGDGGNPYKRNRTPVWLGVGMAGALALAGCATGGSANAGNTASASASPSTSMDPEVARVQKDMTDLITACGKIATKPFGAVVHPAGGSANYTYDGWAESVDGQHTHVKCGVENGNAGDVYVNTGQLSQSSPMASSVEFTRLAGTADEPRQFHVAYSNAETGNTDSADVGPGASDRDAQDVVKAAEALLTDLLPAGVS